ncbi:hypothetical protein LWI28_008674 [Acer negundo]|uniref:DUF295 domain-containing protein n=1 Tax=Acer negundo TaxID=4023 RepID=A0AAD5J8I7_ACENE|nr:hypothetical protein LWI28_008674 [Acer negundo]
MDIQNHKREDEKNSRDWSGLHNNVIIMISDKLSLCDSLSFSNVCKPWRSLQKETLTIHRNTLHGFPWLLMSKEIGSEPKRCFSVLENKLWKMKMPKADRGLMIQGSFEDWLIFTKSPSDTLFGIRISLLNPFSGAEVVLPKADTRYHKLVFSGDPNKETCVYMAFSYVSRVFFRMDSRSKRLVGFLFGGRVVDAVYAYSTVQSVDFDHYSIDHPMMIDTRFHEVKMSPDIQIQSDLKKQLAHYLVEFCGEILLVIRFTRNLFKETYDFKVFRLDFGQMEWVKLDNLGDFSIFLGMNCTRCYSTKELGVNKGNCIYFTNEFGPMGLVDRDNLLSCSDIDGWGIFRLNSGEGNSDSGFETSYHN